MDPNATLERILAWAQLMVDGDEVDGAQAIEEADEIAEAIIDLHEWIHISHGSLPKAWDPFWLAAGRVIAKRDGV